MENKNIKYKALKNGYPSTIKFPNSTVFVDDEYFTNEKMQGTPIFVGTQFGIFPRHHSNFQKFMGQKIAMIGKSLLSGVQLDINEYTINKEVIREIQKGNRIIVIEEKKNKKRINKWDIITFVFNFAIFFCGFGFGGIYLISGGFDESNYISISIGIMIFSIGFFHMANSYLPEKNWISYIFGFIPVIIFLLFNLFFIGSLIFILFYIPFYEKSNLDWDLGILILKDGFVRFLISLIDLFLIYYIWKYLKIKLRKLLPTKNIVHLADSANNEDDSNK